MKIHPIFFIIVSLCFSKSSLAQEILKIEKLEDARLVKILNNAKLIGENSEKYLSVRIFTIDNGSGSAGFESCEVSHNLLIAVSEFDEEPNQSLFEIGPFYNPKVVKWSIINKSEKEIEIEYGSYDNQKKVKLKVDINNLKILKK